MHGIMRHAFVAQPNVRYANAQPLVASCDHDDVHWLTEHWLARHLVSWHWLIRSPIVILARVVRRRALQASERRITVVKGKVFERMTAVYDERCAADLGNVIEGRALSAGDAAWLTRVVTGAIRPNRDKPLWDLAHLLRALGGASQNDGQNDGGALCDLALDPRLARADQLEAQLRASTLAPDARLDERGVVLETTPQWRASWTGISRLLALAEFLLTADDLANFAEVRGWFSEVGGDPDSAAAISQLLKRLSRMALAYRQAHLPLAPVERRFRAILIYLAEQRNGGGVDRFDDNDIFGFWSAGDEDGERPQFRTVADHFLTYQKALAALGGLRGVRAAASLEDMPGWGDRLDADFDHMIAPDPSTTTLAARLSALPDTPKILTGAERDDLAGLFWLETFHKTHPLTVLRSVSFGRVQSGIANRLRRGGGGDDIAARVLCGDAVSYADIRARADALSRHLMRMVRIAAALRIAPDRRPPHVAEALAAADADLARVRRAGFDAPRQELAEVFAAIDAILAEARDEIEAFIKAALTAEGRFEMDRTCFAEVFQQTYLNEASTPIGQSKEPQHA